MDNFPDLKLLKSLADVCRKSGISSFEGFGFKFEIEPAHVRPPRTRSRSKAKTQDDAAQELFLKSWDEMSEEEKLFYSVEG